MDTKADCASNENEISSSVELDSSQKSSPEHPKGARRSQRSLRRRGSSVGGNTDPGRSTSIRSKSSSELVCSEECSFATSDKTVKTTPQEAVTGGKVKKKSVKRKKIHDPRITPKVDCPEKIVFCIDMSSDMNKSPFNIGKGHFSPICMVKRTVEMFMLNKLKINKKHEFAVIGFHNTAVWVANFTSEIKKMSSALDQLYEMNICEDSALPSVFKLISVVAADLPSFQRPEIVPPPFIFRVILIYGRSRCLPENEKVEKVLKKLKLSPYFFLDILYLHEAPSSENNCQEIFDCLCDFDEKGTSYIFEVGRNTTKLHNCMAKFLAHPLQRPLQKHANYKLSLNT